MSHPLAIYNIEKADGHKSNKLVWAEVIRGRYAVEVHHTGACKGDLLIFDSRNNFRIIHEEPVVVHFNGNPVDKEDIALWRLTANVYAKKP